MWPYVIAIGVIVLIIVLYVVSYNLNEKTEKPENCEDISCGSCASGSCSHRKQS